MNSHHVTSCHRNSYLLYEFFIYFLTIYFHNWLSNVWRAFESHWEYQVLVFTKWCDDGTGVLTLLSSSNIEYCIPTSSLVKNLYSEYLWKMSVIIGNGYCLHLMTLFSWRELLIQHTLLSFFGDDAYSPSYCGAKTPSPTRWMNSFLKVFKWIWGTG